MHGERFSRKNISMIRILLLVIAVAIVLWYGRQYIQQHPSEGGTSGTEESTSGEPGQVASATPREQTFDGCRDAIRNLSQKVLVPIESSKELSEAAMIQSLRNLETELATYKLTPDFTRTKQACSLLEQALQERSGFAQRAQAPPPGGSALDQKSTTATGLNIKSLNKPGAASTPSNASFFQEAAQRQWRDRCEYYRPLVSRLLMP